MLLEITLEISNECSYIFGIYYIFIGYYIRCFATHNTIKQDITLYKKKKNKIKFFKVKFHF